MDSSDTNAWKKDLVKIITDEFHSANSGGRKVSLRAFAKRIGLSPSALSAVLNNDESWGLSARRGGEVLDLLKIDDRERRRMKARMGLSVKRAREAPRVSLPELLTEWYYLPVAACFELPVAERAVSAVAGRLGIPAAKVEAAVEALLNAGYLVRKNDVIERAHIPLPDGEGASERERQVHHVDNFKRATDVVLGVPGDDSDFVTATFAGNSALVPQVREEFRLFRERIAALMSEDPADEVFRLSIALLPLRGK